MARLVAAALDDDWATARALNRRYFPLITANFWESESWARQVRDGHDGPRCHEIYRLPMVPALGTRAKPGWTPSIS